MAMLFTLAVTFLMFSQSLGFLGNPNVAWNGPLPPDEWITQPLDHFNDADTRTWKQRYFVNGTFYKPGGPVFLMIGGEGTADPIWMVTGTWIKYAQTFNALCLQLEHRYYGKSHPTIDMNVDNLAHLSSEQALADLASFRNFIGKKMNVTDNKWITFGGSYPGTLSAWFRLKYPHLVHGAVATSAPILAHLNFKEYLGVVRDALATTGAECKNSVASATSSVLQMIGNKDGRKELKKVFKLCDDIDEKIHDDISNLFSNLANNFNDVVQYNKDNRAFEGAVGTNITVDTLCQIMTDTSRGSTLQRYADVNTLILKTYKQKCMDYKYSNMINNLKAVSWNSTHPEGVGARPWMYQTCTEFGFYQSSDLLDQPFGHKFPLDFWVKQCVDVFGPKFNKAFIENGIEKTNTNYGGYGLKVTRVVFPNGSIDPWHALGVTKDLSDDATAIFIKGTAHCANMYPETKDDLPQLLQARMDIEKLIGKWLSQS